MELPKTANGKAASAHERSAASDTAPRGSETPVAAALSWGGGIRAYFRALASGTEPLHRVVISDMLIGGTLINVIAMAAAFGLFGIEAPTWLATAVFFLPVPYNLFLVFVVWKTSDLSGSAWTWPARLLSFIWLGVMFFI